MRPRPVSMLATSLLALAISSLACTEKLAPPPATQDPAAVPSSLADLAPAAPAEAPSDTAGATAPGDEGRTVVRANGELRSPMQSNLTVRIGGRVARVAVEEGETVAKGRVLLVLETDYLDLELERARAEVSRAEAVATEAQRELDRKLELFARDSVPPATRDKAQAARDQAVAALAAARAALGTSEQRRADATLVAPFTGVVVERRAAVGGFLDDKATAFVLAQSEPLRLRFDLPERLLDRVRRGQILRATVDPYPGETFTGTVSLVSQSIDPQSRTFFVEAELANRDGRLKPGLFARVELTLD